MERRPGPCTACRSTSRKASASRASRAPGGFLRSRNSKAPAHAEAVRRLLDAGAVLLGATNVPHELMDSQSFNDIYGTSNNPWDLARTPGGSSGGTAASLAAGMAFFSIGSDIGGSIRARRRSAASTATSRRWISSVLTGHTPGGTHGASRFLHVAGGRGADGPQRRRSRRWGCAILAGPEAPDAKAFQWSLPAARHDALRDFRIGYVLEDPAVPVSVETKSVLEAAVRACRARRRHNARGVASRLSLPGTDRLLPVHARRDRVQLHAARPARARQGPIGHAAGAIRERRPQQLRRLAASRTCERLAYRAAWERYFETVDVFLLPTTFTAAFPHDHSHPDQRMIPLPEGGAQPSWSLLDYISPATLTGCPATTAPVGLSRSGLPVGLQIVGPYLEDATPIAFAKAARPGDRRLPGPEGLRL